VAQPIHLQQRLQLDDAGQVGTLEPTNGQLQALLHVGVDALRDQLVQIDGAAQQLDVALLQQRFVAIVARIRLEVVAEHFALEAEALVQIDAAGQLLVVGEDLFAQLVDELVEAEVDLGLDFVVEELLAEDGEGVEGRVVVEVQGVEDVPGSKGEIGE
jgi:hypothetical protein